MTGFDLDFALRKFDMSVDLGLRKLELDMLDAAQRQSLIDTGDSQTEDLMKVAYRKVQKESPEYMTVFDGADQSIAVDLTTFRIHAKPEPLLALYDFIMTTFVPNNPDQAQNDPAEDRVQAVDKDDQQGDNGDKIRIRVKLRSIERGSRAQSYSENWRLMYPLGLDSLLGKWFRAICHATLIFRRRGSPLKGWNDAFDDDTRQIDLRR